MITLFQTTPAWGLSTFSPFCLKVETYLRMTELPYVAKAGDIRKAPMGKIPWIEDEGTVIGDSTAIISYLQQRYGDPLDAKLDNVQRAHALTMQRMMEDHLYFALAYMRWSSDAAWPYLCAVIAPLLPPVLGTLLLPLIRKRVLRSMYVQGIARHSRDAILERIRQDTAALSTLLGEQPFFLGDQATTIDAVMYGFWPQFLDVPWPSPEKDIVREHSNLVEFCKRMKARYFATQTDADV